MPNKDKNAPAIAITPTINMESIMFHPNESRKKARRKVKIANEPRTILGTVVVTVALMLVPNCSEAVVTNTAQ